MQKIIRMRILLIYFSFMVAISSSVNAQNSGASIFEPKLTGKLFIYDSNIIGEQYFSKQWCKGDLKLNNGLIIRDEYLKYNCYLSKFIHLNDSNIQVELDDALIDEVTFFVEKGNKTVFRKIWYKSLNQKDSIRAFAQVLSEDKNLLIVHRLVVNDKNENVTTSSGTYSKTRVMQKPLYIFKLRDGRDVVISSLRTKSVINSFANNSINVKELMKKNRLKIRNEYDLVRLNYILDNY